jgi:DNA-binding beta-propeller fold protein YncE
MIAPAVLAARRGVIAAAALIAASAAAATGAPAAIAQAPAPATTTFGDEPGTLRLPEAVAFTPGGDLLVGDHFSGRIQRFRDGRFVSAFGLRGEGCGRLGAVAGLAADRQGNTYVLDTDQQLVQVFDAAGASVRCFGGRGTGRGKLRTGSGAYAASSASGGIAVTDRYVYVADAGNNRVQRFSLTGKNPKVLGKGRLRTPQGLAVRGSRLLVADDANHRLVELTTSGRFVRAASQATGVRLRFPYDVALDAKGKAYVADNNLHRIVQVDRRLRRVRAWGAQGQGPGKFVFPRAVAVHPRTGHLVVADAGNDRVQEFTATGGYVRTIGRNGRARPHITAPADVAVNRLGEVAVADGNGRISWFDLGGRFLGAWAQSRSFQQSTAVVSRPTGVAFGGDRELRVADGGSLRSFTDGAVDGLLGGGLGSPGPSSVDVGPTGTVWAAQGSGQFTRVTPGAGAPTWLGTRGAPGRTTTAIAELADGSVAVAEGTSPHQRKPADGTVIRYDATGRRLGTWAVPRPAGGQPSRPGGLAATADGGAWVSDAANDRLLRLGPGGAIAAVLGAPGSGDGGLAEPRGLALDCAGGLLVADSGNNRIVRFAGVAPAAGCAAAGTPTADGRPPGPVGLKVKTKQRARRPAARLGTITATCARACTLKVESASVGTIGRGAARSYPLTTTVRGRTITVRASAATVAALEKALRAGDSVSGGVVVTATAKDGVIDTAAVSWRFS